MLKAEATLEAACSNQPLLSFTSCTRSYFCCWLGSTSPRLPTQGPAGGSGPGMAGVAGGVPAAAGSQPPRCTSGGEKTAGSRGSGSHATVEQKLRGGKGSRARAARKQQRYANAVEKLTACKGASSTSPSCSGAVSTEAFSVSLSPPRQVSDSVREAISGGLCRVPNQPGSCWLAGREVLSGKQSHKNQKDIYFHIYKAGLQREVHRCLVSSAGAEL